MKRDEVIDTIMRWFRQGGTNAYFGEAVTQTEHALQSAHLASTSGASDELVAASLLHDIGHLMRGLPEDVAKRGIDGTHEDCGADWLERHFGDAVSKPVRLHVAAKRYLCAVEPAYLASLSAASQLSLRLQGGPFSADDVRRFEDDRYFGEAVQLRRWDDQAKIPGLKTPDLQHYRSALETALKLGGKTS